MTLKSYLIAPSVFFCQVVLGQDLKSLEFRQQYARNKVYSRDCYDVKFQGNTPVDSIHVGYEEFDKSGRIVRYVEFSPKGKQSAEFHFEYDANGKLIRNTMTHAYTDWKQLELTLTFDEKGRVVSRQPQNPVPGLWSKELFFYNEKGHLVRSEQWYDIKGELKRWNVKEYKQTLEKIENSLSYIYDQRDLLIVEQFYTEGISDVSRNYFYTFY